MAEMKAPNKLEINRSEQTKKRISDSLKKIYQSKPYSEERKKKISEKMKYNWLKKKEFNNMLEKEINNEKKQNNI